MILSIFIFVCAVALLAWAADRFVVSSIAMARRWHWPPVVIGVVLVGFGTSFPELLVSLSASWQGQATIAVANVVGSNIANMALIGGCVCLCFSLVVSKRVWCHDLPVFLGLSAFAGLVLWLFGLSVITGCVLLLLLCIVLWDALRSGERSEPLPDDSHPPIKKTIFWWVLSLVLLFISAEVLVRTAVSVAHQWGWSDWLIGVTVVTLGTSLPELATTIMSARRGHDDVALGHLLGSNLFNTTAVLAMPAFFAHKHVSLTTLPRDWLIMMAMGLLFGFLFFLVRKKPRCPRWVGAILLIVYAAYMWVVVS